MTTKKSKRGETNGWDALQNVLIASLSKGQFPIAVIGFLAAIILWRMPETELLKFINILVDKLEYRFWAGYIITVILALGWFFHARRLRTVSEMELRRVSEERNSLQDRLLNKKLESSRSC